MSVLGPLQRGWSRLTQRASLNQGFVVDQQADQQNVFRDPKLEKLDSYFENRQYDKLAPWETFDPDGTMLPLRKRQPKIKVPYARSLCSIVASKLIGPTVFPSFRVEEDPDAQEYWRAIVEISQIQMFLLEPVRRMINTGEIFVRFYMDDGAFVKEVYDSKFCYPEFNPAGELVSIRIQYVFSDPNDKDDQGNPRRKWFRLDLGQEEEVTYDNPLYVPSEQDPQFTVVDTVTHGFGFVQGEWLTTTGVAAGYGLTSDIMDFIDELCYSLSQSSKSVSYNQDPQLTFKNMQEEDFMGVVRSVANSWNLGKTGEANFLETDLTGVQRAMELRDKVRLNIQDISRVVMLDPEKIVGNAQSAKAMEVLHGPLKDLVDEMRLPVGQAIKRLVMKMGAANILGQQVGMPVPLPLPPNFVLKTLDLVLKWPAIFQQTLEDTKNKVAIAAQALMSGLIAPRTATKYVADDFGIDNIEEELAEIAAHQASMAALNPFGGGFK